MDMEIDEREEEKHGEFEQTKSTENDILGKRQRRERTAKSHVCGKSSKRNKMSADN